MMTIKGGTRQACAACKHQRRKCQEDCLLAPYFPADKPKDFENAHRLFGIGNITKLLLQVRDDQRDDTMKSIIYESNIRQKFPVFGCVFVLRQLDEQLKQFTKELYYVNSLLKMLRNKEYCNGYLIPDHLQIDDNNKLGLSNSSNYQFNVDEMYSGSHQFFGCDKDVNNKYGESSDVKPLWMQQQEAHDTYYLNPNFSSNSTSLETKIFSMQQAMMQMPLQQDNEGSHDHDYAFLDTIVDNRLSYIESKDASCESSGESTLQDTKQFMDTSSQNQEFKNATTRFSRMTVNK